MANPMRIQKQPNSNEQKRNHLLADLRINTLSDFELIDDDNSQSPEPDCKTAPWQILVVDDDDEVHAATKFALKSITVLDRPIQVIHAYSAQEGFQRLQESPNISVALLDVVMESEDAGLKLVERIRKSGYDELRIVLRTGQPGYAPELSVLQNYDINDYRTKSELTRARLISLLTTSLRSYRQIHIIKESRRGLNVIVESTRDIFKRKNLDIFSQCVLTQLLTLLDAPTDGLVCLMANEHKPTDNDFKVLTATGLFKPLNHQNLVDINDAKITHAFQAARSDNCGIYLADDLGLYFRSSEGKQLFIYVKSSNTLNEEYISLLKIFVSNIAVGFDNLALVDRLDQLAFIDTVLQIPNRNAFERSFAKLKQIGKRLSIALIHINSLSQCVSAFGTSVVNQAIVKIRNDLLDRLTPTPHLIAYDGKADLILISEYNDIDVEKINTIFETKVVVDEFTLPFSAIISIVDPDETMNAQTAMRCATSALLIAGKTPGTNVMHYHQSMTQGLTERIMLQAALRKDLENKCGIEAHLQPKVRCDDGVIIGAEALCRWNYSGRWIPPCDFIPIAEASGLSQKITDRMLELVSEFAQQRNNNSLAPLPVAVNLSMHDLQANQFAETLLLKLERLNLTNQLVEFEITESATMHDPEHAITELAKLHQAGYLIAIDDFGTGYSSLNYLERLPVSALKIDKTFIDTLDIRSAKRSLAASTISIAELMDLYVIAEGIETKEQHDALLFLGCDACQGYYFAKPQPMSDFNKLFADGIANKSLH